MTLLPIRHPQRDFFVLDIADVVLKDDMASMEHPFFSLATKPDMRSLTYEVGENTLRIEPSSRGLPTIFDKDILIFCISQLMYRKARGEPIGKNVRFSAYELLVATNRPTNDLGYERLESAFLRLRGTSFISNIRNKDYGTKAVFGMIDRGGFTYRIPSDRRDYCEVVLSDWIMDAIENSEVLTISPDYFRLRRPIERRLYEIARKFCGSQSKWQCSLDKLQVRTGSGAPQKKFRHNLRQIIQNDHLPQYQLALNDNDVVEVVPKTKKTKSG